MSITTPDQLFKQGYDLYKRKQYAEALDLIAREAERFPEVAARAQFWRACLTARLGDPQQALDILKAAVDAGHWYSKRQLRDDADLASLHGLPWYERLVDICLERFAAAQEESEPQLLVVEPKVGSGPRPLLIALHGNNSSAQACAEYWRPAASAGWLLALPQSSLLGGPGTYVWDDWDLAAQEIAAHYRVLRERYVVDEEQVVLGGFSKGAGLAVWLALNDAPRACGFVAVGPYLPPEVDVASVLKERETREKWGYVFIGARDEVCYPIAQALAATLREGGNRIEVREYPDLDHAYPADFERVLPRALDFGARP
jgi:dienelactone hydrolase